MSKGGFFADIALARRVESTDAWIGLGSARIHAQLHPESGASSMEVAGGFALYTGAGSPLTQVLGIGLDGEVTSTQIDGVESFFRARGANVSIELCPFADRSLLPYLASRGYELTMFSNMLVRRFVPPAPAITPGEATVQQCAPAEAEVWARTVLEGFTGAIPLSDESVSVLVSLFHQPETVCLLARVGGTPAGAGAISIHQGVAAMYGASTLPAFRRRGIQGSIIQSLVTQATDAGCDIGYTLTEPGSASQRNLERQDYRVAYTRVTMTRRLFGGDVLPNAQKM
jgi:ribosomal protein S18 acetylase RimI-like enzyme